MGTCSHPLPLAHLLSPPRHCARRAGGSPGRERGAGCYWGIGDCLRRWRNNTVAAGPGRATRGVMRPSEAAHIARLKAIRLSAPNRAPRVPTRAAPRPFPLFRGPARALVPSCPAGGRAVQGPRVPRKILRGCANRRFRARARTRDRSRALVRGGRGGAKRARRARRRGSSWHVPTDVHF